MTIDFGRTASDYGRYRAGYPPQLFDRLGALGIGRPGQRVLDLGTGTGFFGRGLALRGAEVTGLDPSEALMAEARRLDAEAGVALAYVTARAEDTGLPPASFDVVSAAQCWHWFDAFHAAAEARRLLLPGGWLVIVHYDWLPLPGSVVEATERLILHHNPAWRGAGGTGMHPEHLSAVAGAGFQELTTLFLRRARHLFARSLVRAHPRERGRRRQPAPGEGGRVRRGDGHSAARALPGGAPGRPPPRLGSDLPSAGRGRGHGENLTGPGHYRDRLTTSSAARIRSIVRTEIARGHGWPVS